MIPRLLAIAIAAFTIGADCSGSTPKVPQPPNAYCGGAVAEPEPTLFESAIESVSSALATIIGGEVSVDRRATVKVISPTGYCSGTVVGKRTVLTAAHCEAEVMDIIVDGQRVQASRVIPHPNYNGTFPLNDLMLLWFEQDLPGPIVDTVYTSDLSESCTQLIAQGYGKSEFNEPATLRESTYTVPSADAMVLRTKQASWGGICFGDSGGPLYAVVDGELQIAGVTSTTYTQDCLVGGDHVNLRFYRDWLAANVR